MHMSGTDEGKTWIKVSSLTLRRVVGILGILLPIIVMLGTWLFTLRLEFRTSISAYYDSVRGPAFAGILFVACLLAFQVRSDTAFNPSCHTMPIVTRGLCSSTCNTSNLSEVSGSCKRIAHPCLQPAAINSNTSSS